MATDDEPENTQGRVKAIFSSALAKNTPEERQQYLAETCGDNQDLRQRVESLLAAHDQAGDFLDRSALGDDTDPLSEGPGTVIGHYRLIEKLGEGGFGVVYLAEQAEPIRRQVALKIIKLGMDTRQVIGRFEAERQALALMDHPNIAHVYEAGTTETGRPYFVMELVRGTPITEYSDAQRLTTAQRLDLFMQVCGAIQHAHQKGIIHRDLKPSNIVVSLQDGRPVPKVIDFGIAKSTLIRLTDKTQFARHDLVLGTPAYMSPEQVGVGEADVDSRSDIYSLGVLLYELLTGSLPFGSDTLRLAAIEEVRRIILEEEPKKPSTRLASLGAKATEVAERRALEPAGLSRLLRDDLDWIVMKALEKERSRRYETVSGLAEDLRRHLRHEPVTAGPPSTAYRVRKFVRRHRHAVLAGGGVLAALLAGLGLATIGFVRAAKEREQALALIGLLRGMLGADSPAPAKGYDWTVRQMVDEFAASLEDRLPERPEVVGEVHQIVGRVYNGLFDFDAALPHIAAALELKRRAHGPKHPAVAECLTDYSYYLGHQRRELEAETRVTEAIAIYRDQEVRDARLMRALLARSSFRLALGVIDKAEPDAREALELAEQTKEALAGPLYALAWVEMKRGDHEKAEQSLKRVVEIEREQRQARGPASAYHLKFALRQLGRLQVLKGQYAEAESCFREALPLVIWAYGDEHRDTFMTLTWLRGTLLAQRKQEPELERFAHRRAIQQANSPDRPAALYRLRIQTPGQYQLYLRYDGQDGDSDSVWARIDELSDGVGGRVADVYGFPATHQGHAADADFATEPGWQGIAFFEEIGGWRANGWTEWKPEMPAWPGEGPAVWTISAPGDYTLRFVMREPGAALDAFVFQIARLPAPTGSGPGESDRNEQGIFREAEGQIVAEAEHFTERSPGRSQEWRVVPAEGSSQSQFKNFRGQGYLQALPIKGVFLWPGRGDAKPVKSDRQ
jgi:serine/threonine protein kinase/tetratricopeptide (TPR) repeat protein